METAITLSIGSMLSLGRCLHSVLHFFNGWRMLELCIKQSFYLESSHLNSVRCKSYQNLFVEAGGERADLGLQAE